MAEVADIVRLHGEAYRHKYRHLLTSDQKQALADIQHCRTPFFGGHVHRCDHCDKEIYSYHSCRNRSCPKCHHDQTERWLARQRDCLPPCPYYLLTFTLPSELHAIARTHPRKVYSLLMTAAADALQKLARDPRYLGARVGALAVLHTWTRAMLFHPHVHMLVTAGGVSLDGSSRWVPPQNPAFLLPVRALSILFRAKLCAALKRANLLGRVPVTVWKKPWVVHSQHAGSGHKVLDYLGRYVFRIAISNSRIDSIGEGTVQFHYRDNRTQQIRHLTLSGEEFLRRFLEHVLPRGLMKVRHYGILSRRYRRLLVSIPVLAQPHTPPTAPALASTPASSSPRCPLCRVGLLIPRRHLAPVRSHSP